MILLGIFLLPAIFCAICVLVGLFRHFNPKTTTGYFSDGLIGAIVVGIITFAIAGILTFATSADGRAKVNSIQTINQKLEVVQDQKRGLIQFVDEALGPEQVALIADALSTDSQSFQIFLQNNQAVSGLVIDRANKIIDANAVIFELQNKIRDEQSAICANRNNPFVPIFPPFYPDCDLDWDSPVNLDPSFYGGDE